MKPHFYEVDRFTQRMVRYKQIMQPGQRVNDCDIPYVYIRKRLYKELGDPPFVQISIAACNFDSDDDPPQPEQGYNSKGQEYIPGLYDEVTDA